MIKLLKKGDFDLYKWHNNIISDKDDISGKKDFIEVEKGQESKLLGIRWNSIEDTLRFIVRK